MIGQLASAPPPDGGEGAVDVTARLITLAQRQERLLVVLAVVLAQLAGPHIHH